MTTTRGVLARPGATGSSPAHTRPPELVAPRYAHSTLADLMPSIGAHLGVPGCADDVLGLSPSERYVVVLIDGLGWHLIRRSIRDAPYLAGLLGDGRPITSGVPSTTVTSLTSLGTGLPPGQHGMVGYTARVPETGAVLNALTWDAEVDPRAYQPRPTFFERAAEAGVRVCSVGLERFADSGLTVAALRGAEFVGVSEERALAERVAVIAEAAGRGERSVVYAYERQLDHHGHVSGCESEVWRRQLSRIDAFCEQLRDALPDEVTMIITGDHGMIDIPDEHRIVIEDHPELITGVDTIAGEGRFRQLYLPARQSGSTAAAARLADRWADLLGDRAWVRVRDDAVDDGWFGPVSEQVLPRYGDVLVALRDDWAVMTRQYPRELSLIGMHGSLTPAEMIVPLFSA